MQVSALSSYVASKRAAIFLDRDGTLNLDVGYVSTRERFLWLPNSLLACWQLMQLGYQLVIVTNQSGIARNYFSEGAVHRLHAELQQEAERVGVKFLGIYFCPHHPEGQCVAYRKRCLCRKPEPGLLLKAAQAHRINLKASVIIGDKLSDIQAGRRAGLGTCILLHSYLTTPDATAVLPNLSAVPIWLRSRIRTQLGRGEQSGNYMA